MSTIESPRNEVEAQILTAEASAFLTRLARQVRRPRRRELLARRRIRQQEIDAGEMPDFLPETAGIRRDRVDGGAASRHDLLDRRVEITGPGGPEDDHQCPELRRQRLHGRF